MYSADQWKLVADLIIAPLVLRAAVVFIGRLI